MNPTMNPTMKEFLIVVAKQAVIGASTVTVAIWQSPATYQLSTGKGWEHVGLLLLGAIGTREAIVWGPKVLAWANS